MHASSTRQPAAQALLAEFATLPSCVARYVPRHCLAACLERAKEGSGFIARLSKLLASEELLFDKDHMFLCALLSSAAGSALVREGGEPLAAVCSYAKKLKLYVLRAELRLGPSPALAWAWAGPPTRRTRRRRSTMAC